jgi:hypothetical protein
MSAEHGVSLMTDELPAELRAVLATEGLEEEVAMGVAVLARIAAALETLAALVYVTLDEPGKLHDARRDLIERGFLQPRLEDDEL